MSETIPISSAAIDAENPWPGLATFTEDQRAYFHGRDEEIADLTQLAERRPLVVLFGQSGLGKSSILQAGVFPRLRVDGFCPIYIRLDHAETAPTPSEQVKALVKIETTRVGAWTRPGAARPGETLWEFFHHRDDRLLDRDGLGVVPVLVFDQFEELFTLGAARGERRERAVAFMRELAELVENRPSAQLVARLDQSSAEMDAFDFGRTDYRVIISLREDFLSDLETLKTIMPALMQKRMRLARMTGQQALEAVLKPGAGLVDADVARAIVEFVAGARGGSAERLAELDVEPALLSVVCREFNERRRANGQAKITLEQVSGDRREILTDFYERSVVDLPAAMRAFVEDRLLTKSGFRDNLALESALEEPGVTRELIDALVARRLLRIEERAGIQRVELTHDVLADVVRASRDARQQRLALAGVTRRARRQRWLITGLGTAVVALGVGALLGVRAQRIASKRASDTDVVLASRLLEEGKTSDGLAYLVRAVRRDPQNTMLGPRLLSTLVGHNFLQPEGAPLALPSPAVGRAVYLSDGQSILVQGADGVIRAIDTTSWRVAREFRFEKKVLPDYWALASGNDRVLAVGLEDGSIVVCDTRTGAPRAAPFRPKEAKPHERFFPILSPDGRWLATSNNLVRGTMWLWDAETGEQRASLPSLSREIIFSPDSLRFATVGGGFQNRPRTFQFRSLPSLAPVGQSIIAPAGGFGGVIDPDGQSLVVAGFGNTQVFDVGSGAPKGSPFKSVSLTTSAIMTPDGRRVVVTGDREAQVIDLATGKLAFPPLAHGGPVYNPVLSRDSRILLTTCADGLARLWDMESGKLLAEPTLQQEGNAPAALSPDGTQVVIFSSSGAAYRLRIGRGAAQTLHLPHQENSAAATFMPSPPSRLLRRLRDRAVAIDVSSGRETQGGFAYPEALAASPQTAWVRSFVSRDQQLVVARSEINGKVGWHAWQRDAGGAIVRDTVVEDIPADAFAVFHPTRDFVAIWLRILNQGNASVSDLQTGRKILVITRDLPISQVQFSADGNRIGVRTSDGAVSVCAFPSGTEQYVLRMDQAAIQSWLFSPDGTRIITGDSNGGLQYWDAADGRLVRAVQRHRDAINGLRLSPDGRTFLSFSRDGTGQLWDVATGLPRGGQLVHSAAVAYAAFSEPDGKRIVTSTTGGQVRLWDTASGQPLTESMQVEGSAEEAMAFSPDGRFFLTRQPGGGEAIGYRIWAVPPDAGEARVPSWLIRLATICSSKRLTDDGEFVSAADEMAKLDDVRRELAALPADAPYAEWGRWFLADRATRSIAPGFKITPAEAEKLVKEMAAPKP